jgi:hypothetical protein
MSGRINTADAMKHTLDSIHLRIGPITTSLLTISPYCPVHNHNHDTNDAGSDRASSPLRRF